MLKKFDSYWGYFIIFLFLIDPLEAVGQNSDLITPEVETARTDAYEKQLKVYLRHYLVEEYEARSEKAWKKGQYRALASSGEGI